MVKLYKDLLISYFLVVVSGSYVLLLMLDSLVPDLIQTIVVLLWIFFCAKVFHRIAVRRFNKIILRANNTCKIEDSLNYLFGIYKGSLGSKIDLVVAIYICNLLLHFGKYTMALKFLLSYNPEILFKRKKEVTYKYLYYNILSSCYVRLDRKDDARNAFNKADQAFQDPSFNKKFRDAYTIMHKINYLLMTDDGVQVEEILSLLDEALINSKSLLSKVSCRFFITYILEKHGRIDEAKEHLEFIRNHGGDTIYAKCVLQNNFSQDFINAINLESWEPKPIKEKEYKTPIISIVLAVALVVLAAVFAGFKMKTNRGTKATLTEEELMEINQLRVDYDLGTCRNLNGDVSVILFYMDDFESSWTAEEITNFTNHEVKPGLEFLEKQARKRGVKLKFCIEQSHTSLFYDGEVILSAKETGLVTIDVLSQAANGLNYSSDEEMITRLKSQYGTEVVCMTIFHKNGTAYAINPHRGETEKVEEHGVIFAYDLNSDRNDPTGSQASIVAHELLHLFGAEDLYATASRKNLAKKYYPNDIMLGANYYINTNNIDDATAFYIGWTDKVPKVLYYEKW